MDLGINTWLRVNLRVQLKCITKQSIILSISVVFLCIKEPEVLLKTIDYPRKPRTFRIVYDTSRKQHMLFPSINKHIL